MAGAFLQTIFDEVRQALDRGETDLAISIARHIFDHAPAVIEGQRLLGEAYLNAGQFEPASVAFENVLRADPEHIAAYYGLGLAQRSLNRTSQAIHALERALEIQPNLAELRTQLLQLYALTPNSAGQFRLSRSGLGRLYARGQMYTQAIDEYRAVLDNEPDRDDIRVALAEALWRDGQEDAAIEWCRQTVESKPDLFKPTLILGYLQLAAGQPEGEALWRRAAAQEPSLATAEALFEVLPPTQIDEPTIPAFDEVAWRASSAAQTDATIPAAPPMTASTQSDDDLLASLLGFGFDADPAPVEPRALIAVPALSDAAPAADPTSSSVTGADAQAPEPAALNADVVAGEPSRVRVYEAVPGEVEVLDAPTGGRAEVLVTASPSGDLPGSDAQPYPMFRRPQWSTSTAFGRVEPFRLEDWDATARSDEPAVPVSDAADTTDERWFANADEATPVPASASAALPIEETVIPVAPTTEVETSPASEPVAPTTEVETSPASEPVAPTTEVETSPASEPVASTTEAETAPVSEPVIATEETASATIPVAQIEQSSQQPTPTTDTLPDTADPYRGVKPFSLADLDDEPFDDDRASFELDTSEDVRPFSLRELGLERNTSDAAPKPSVPGYVASDAPATREKPASSGSLGLSDDDLTAWELAARGEPTPYEPPVDDTPTFAQEPVTPFSLADLGLSDEEEMERWSVDAPLSSAGRPAPGEETTPFSLADFEPTPSTEPTPAFAPVDTAVHEAETQPFDVSALLGDEAPVAEQPMNAPAPPLEATSAPTPERSTFRRFHEQLAINPDNHTLRLALARANLHQHDVEQAFEQYRQLVQRDALFEPVLEDLNDILQSTEDRAMLRRVHKLMGDIYMAQGRTDEALDAYGWTG